jgi:hypothetical protein
MTLTYSLDQNDFLQYQLFTASKSDRIKKKRTKTWLILSGSWLLFSFVFYQRHDTLLFYLFLAYGLITLLFYPYYQRRQYKNHYAKFIADTYKNRFGKTSNITFTETALETNDITGESKINLAQLENLTETANYFYLKMKTGGHIIIPRYKLNNVSEVQEKLKALCTKLSIDFITDLNWKWK